MIRGTHWAPSQTPSPTITTRPSWARTPLISQESVEEKISDWDTWQRPQIYVRPSRERGSILRITQSCQTSSRAALLLLTSSSVRSKQRQARVAWTISRARASRWVKYLLILPLCCRLLRYSILWIETQIQCKPIQATSLSNCKSSSSSKRTQAADKETSQSSSPLWTLARQAMRLNVTSLSIRAERPSNYKATNRRLVFLSFLIHWRNSRA